MIRAAVHHSKIPVFVLLCAITVGPQFDVRAETPAEVVLAYEEFQRTQPEEMPPAKRDEWIARFEHAERTGRVKTRGQLDLLYLADLYVKAGRYEAVLRILDSGTPVANKSSDFNHLDAARSLYRYASEVGDGERSIDYINDFRELLHEFFADGKSVHQTFLKHYDFFYRERSGLQNQIGRKKHARLTMEGQTEEAELAKATHFWMAVSDMEKYVDYVSKTPAMGEQYPGSVLGGIDAYRTMVRLLNEVAAGYATIDRPELASDVNDRTIEILQRYVDQNEIGHDNDLVGELLVKYFENDPTLQNEFADLARKVMVKVDRAAGIEAVKALYQISDRFFEDDNSTGLAIEVLRDAMTYTEKWYPDDPVHMSYYQNGYLTLAFHHMKLRQWDEAKIALDTFASMDTVEKLHARYDDLNAQYESSQKPPGQEDSVSTTVMLAVIAFGLCLAGSALYVYTRKK
jgi:hypothetical protein